MSHFGHIFQEMNHTSFMYHTNMIILREIKHRFHLIYISSDYVTSNNTTQKAFEFFLF